MSPDDIVTALNGSDISVALSAAASPSVRFIGEQFFHTGWRGPEEVLCRLASNPDCPRSVLLDLIFDSSLNVRRAVLKNPKFTVSDRLLAAIHNSKNGSTLELAELDDASPELLRVLSGGLDYFTLFKVANHPNCPIDVILSLLNHFDLRIACAASRRFHEAVSKASRLAWIYRNLGYSNKRILNIIADQSRPLESKMLPVLVRLVKLLCLDKPEQATVLIDSWTKAPPNSLFEALCSVSTGQLLGAAMMLRSIPFKKLESLGAESFHNVSLLRRAIKLYCGHICPPLRKALTGTLADKYQNLENACLLIHFVARRTRKVCRCQDPSDLKYPSKALPRLLVGDDGLNLSAHDGYCYWTGYLHLIEALEFAFRGMIIQKRRLFYESIKRMNMSQSFGLVNELEKKSHLVRSVSALVKSTQGTSSQYHVLTTVQYSSL